MAACGSLEHIFEKPLPESPTFLESLSPWKHIKSMKPIDDSSFTEIFGELHFKENHIIHSSPESSSSSTSLSSSSSPFPQSSPSSSSSSSSNSTFWADSNSPKIDSNGISSLNQEKNKSSASSYYPPSQKRQYGHSDSFSSMNSESLSLCTEGLGFESFDDVDDLLKHDLCNKEWEHQDEGKSVARNSQTENHRNESKISSRISRGEFPPPISCIGRSGKPWVCFKSYREDGRFILKEIRIPTQEFLHACRENGRLKLQFIQSDDEILDEDEEEEEDDEDEDENEENVEEENDDDQEKYWNEREGEGEIQNAENRECDFYGSS